MWVVSVVRELRRPALVYLPIITSRQFSTKINYIVRERSNSIDKNNFFTNILKQNQSKQPIDWSKTKKAIISAGIASDLNVDAFVLNQLSRNSLYEEVGHYVNYLKFNGSKLNLGGIGAIFKCFYQIDKIPNKNLQTVIAEKYILELYNELVSKYKILDETTLENCIYALICTKEWKKCLTIIENMKIMGIPPTGVYMNIIVACFENNEPDLGWKFLREMVNLDKVPRSDGYLSWIDYCLKHNTEKTRELFSSIEKLLYFVSDNNLTFDKIVAEKIASVFVSYFGWSSESVQLKKSSLCPNCNKHLIDFSLTNEEHKKLKDAFFKQVLVKKNVFMNSTPKELDTFLNFIEANAPFDIIVDGLNVAYSIPKMKIPKICSQLIVSVLNEFLENGKKHILVLGRKHMDRWPQKEMSYIRKHALLYLVDDLSYDDTFLLYAALCGKRTGFMSRDLMRGHKFLLSEEKILFEKWQRVRQYSLVHANLNGKVFVKYPLRYLELPQKQVNWHIPYLDDNSKFNDSNKLPWICLKPE